MIIIPSLKSEDLAVVSFMLRNVDVLGLDRRLCMQ